MLQSRSAAAKPAYYGNTLKKGSNGPDIALIQSWLNETLSGKHISVDGRFGSGTESAVRTFQNQAGLSIDGQVGNNTWNALYAAFAAQHGEREIYPGVAVHRGHEGATVKSMQTKLNALSGLYTAIPKINADGKFGSNTAHALRIFQKMFGLTADAVMGTRTFTALMQAQNNHQRGRNMPIPAPYAGKVLSVGSSGDTVRILQNFLTVGGYSTPKIAVDGQYGPATERAVLSFQVKNGLKQDGKVGPNTWNVLRRHFNSAV